MNTRQIADHLQSYGRDEDTMLVHMTPREVGGLQALALSHGGSLTINPDTGLPEAGFLKSILPVIAGAGLSLIPGVGPLMAASLVGGGAAGLGLAKGKSLGQSLGSGLMAGLGAYGGSTLAGSLSKAGAGTLSGATLNGSGASFAPMNVQPTMSGIGAGVKSLGQQGGLSNFASAFKETAGGKLGLGAAALGLGGPLMAAMQPKPMSMPMPQDEYNYEGPYAAPVRNARFPVNRDPYDSSEFQYFDTVNPVPGYVPYGQYAEGGRVAAEMVTDPKARIMYNSNPEQALAEARRKREEALEVLDKNNRDGLLWGQDKPNNNFGYIGKKNWREEDALKQLEWAEQDIKDLEQYMKIRGFTPASIRDEELHFAAGGEVLRDGAFVVDARTVSELGNGSSEAGQELLMQIGGKPIKGPGDGASDSIPAIMGQGAEARVARDEVVFEPEAVKQLGGGDMERGTDMLYDLMARAHEARKTADRGEDTGLRRGLA